MISRKPSRNARNVISRQNPSCAHDRTVRSAPERKPSTMLSMCALEADRRAHPPPSLAERDDRAREGDGADATPRLISIRLPWICACDADAKCSGAIECRDSDEHSGKADERVESRHELRHGGHRECGGRSPRRWHHRAQRAIRHQPMCHALVGTRASVVTTAIAMPTMPNKLPAARRHREESPRSARMNSMAAMR